MKNTLLLSSALGVLTTLAGCGVHISRSSHSWSDADLQASANVIQTAAIPANLQSLDLDNCNGRVHIVGSGTATNAWTWKLTVRARTDFAAQQIASNVTCKVETVGGHLNLAVTLCDTGEPHNIQSDFEINLPTSAAVQAHNRFGAVEVTGLGGTVDVTDENGQVEIQNVGGSVRARTSFDALSVNNIGQATLNNQNGRIDAVNVRGALKATTSFDSLIVKDVNGPAFLANQNGRIEVENVHGLLDAATSFDSLEAKSISGTATLRNQNGRIAASDIGSALDAKTSFDSLVARDIGGPVHLRDQNGAIKISQVKGNADIETSFDNLQVKGIQGDAVLFNQNGGVWADGVTGSVKASTSFAAMEITGAGSKFLCHNQNGRIRLRATSSTVTNIEADTSFDSLEVHLPSGMKPAIQAHTTFAEVESDFPVLMKRRGTDAFQDVSADTARITLENQNGKIGVIRD